MNQPGGLPMLIITSQNVPPTVAITRGNGVPDALWMRVLAEWGASGPAPQRSIAVGQDRFLSRLSWLPDACRRHRVGLQLDDRTRELIVRQRTEANQLADLRERPLSLDRSQLIDRLANSRFIIDDLRSFQERDLARLLALPHGENFSVPGAGKTAVTYALYEAERNAGRVAQLLVVGPISAFEAWETEAIRWLTPPPTVTLGPRAARDTEVLLVNYQRLATSFDEIAAWVASAPTHVVLDEAHRIKRGRGGQWGTASLNLGQLAVRRDVLTGTPAPQHPRDLVALVDFCWPGQGRRVLPAAALVRMPPRNAMPQVQRALAPLFTRTTKRELELPEPRFDVRVVPLQGLHAEIYETLRNRIASRYRVSAADATTLTRMSRVVMYLLEAATNPALLPAGSASADPPLFQHPPLDIPPGSRLADLIIEYGQYETPRKFIELGQIVTSNAERGRKTLVWSNFVRNLEQLAYRVLPGLQPALIHGGISTEESAVGLEPTRAQELYRFRNDPDCAVLLANPAALGEGVSLHQVCNDAVYIDRTFNAGQYLQSLDRIHRLGLAPDQETRITLLLTAGTIDEIVDARVSDKAGRLAAMLDDPSLTTFALPDDDDYGPALDSVEDLIALFADLRGENPPRQEQGA
jgi:hypothetical protein